MDLQTFVYRGTDAVYGKHIDLEAVILAYSKRGAAFTGKLDGRTEGIGGIMRIYTGVGEAWLFFNPVLRMHIKTIIKKLREEIDEAFSSGYWRIEAECQADVKENVRLLEHLGFKRECVKRKGGIEGGDMILFSKIKGE